mmetsp:Transcript_64618/g.97359  ORF Transcript_64618/g.97359 Transcript_64618/m.97359 type:complete len:110 (+) Transcript_64618:105-434(+)
MAPRVTYRRKNSFNTRSNKVRKIRTPGGKIVVQYVGKKSHALKCPLSGERLNGIPALRHHEYKFLKKRERRVSRPYGGVLSGGEVKSRIIRAFLTEEVKIVKKVMSQSK